MELPVDPHNGRAFLEPEAGEHPVERRRAASPGRSDEVLRQIPGRVLLDRLPTPMVGFGEDGDFVYANPACASMLGYDDVAAVLEQDLSSLLAGYSNTSNRECIAMLRAAEGKVVDWRHAEGFPIHTALSAPLLLRADDSVLLINLTDITELLWVEASHARRT